MSNQLSDATWETLSAEILSGMRAWRLQHPKATLYDIETPLDQHWYRLRTCLLEDMALQRAAADGKDALPS